MAAVQLPTLVQNIVLNPVGVKKGATAITKGMKPVQAATNAATASTMKMGQSLNTLGFRAQTFGRTLMKFVVLPMGALAAISLKSFSSFEASFAKIEALVGVAGGAVERFKTDVKGISKATGRAPQELAEAMFFITSAGLRAGTAVDVLNASAKAAAVGLGSTKVVADAATSAVNAYGAENLSGGLAVDVLTAAVREGKVEADRLAPAIGKAIPVASAMGVEFHEVAAAIAAMTRTGTDARTSAIQLRQIMQSLLDPSRQATKAMKEMGIAEGELRDMAKSQGLLAVLKRLRDLSEENADAFADVFPNIRALAGALDITGANLEENEQIFKALANSAGDTDKALKITAKTAAHKMAVAMAELKVNFLELGEAMLPLIGILQKVIGWFAGLINFLSNHGTFVSTITVIGLLVSMLAFLAVGFGHVATSIALKSAALAALTGSTAAATAAGAAHTGGLIRQAAAMMWAGIQAKFAALGVGALGMAIKAMLISTGVGIVLVALGAIFMGFGKKSKTAAEEVNELVASISDVRNFGDRVLSDAGGIGNQITGLSNMSGVREEMRFFEEAFDADIQEAFDTMPESAAGVFETAMVRAFHGAGDSPMIRAAIQQIVSRYGQQFGDENMWHRLFTSEADLSNFLTGTVIGDLEQSEENIAAAIGARTRAQINVSSQHLDELREQYEKDDWTILDMGDVQEAGREFVDSQEELIDDLNNMLRKGSLEDFGVAWAELNSAIVDAMGQGEGSEWVLDKIVEQIPQLEEFTAGASSLYEVLEIIANMDWDDDKFEGISKTLTGTEFDRDGSFAQQALYSMTDINTVLARGQADLLMIGGKSVTERLAEGATKDMLAIELAIERMARSAEMNAIDMESGFSTVEDILTDLESAFAAADKAAKRFNNTFDNFIGRPMNLEQARIDWVESVNDMGDAIAESGGVLNNSSKEAIFDSVESLQDVVANLYQAGRGEEAHSTLVRGFEEIKRVAALAGLEISEVENLYSQIGVTPDTIAISAMSEADAANTEVTQAFEARMDLVLAEGTGYAELTGEQLGTSFVTGMAVGIGEGGRLVSDELLGVIDYTKSEIMKILGIKSPSKVFAVDVGQPITAGVAKGILDGKKGMKNVIREVVDDAMSTAQDALSAASNAITSVFDLGEAQRKLDRLTTTAGGKGVDTKWEKLNRRKLERAVEEAKRNLFLGAGNQEDLEIALMEAEFALEDFDTKADVGREVVDAELELAEAGLKVATATAEMKMEGDEAIETFKALAEAVGLTGDQVSNLISLSAGDEAMMGEVFSPETVQAVKDVAAGLGWISTATGGGDDEDTPWTENDLDSAGFNQVGMWTSNQFGQGGAQSQIDYQSFHRGNTFREHMAQDFAPIPFSVEDIPALNEILENVGFTVKGDLNISMEANDITASRIVAEVSNNVDKGDPSGGGRYGSGGGGRKGHPKSGRTGG